MIFISSKFNNKPIYRRGFAMLVFVVITSFSLLALIIGYLENQKTTMDMIREFSNNEKSVRNLLVCVKGISGVLSKQPNIDSGVLIGLKGNEERGIDGVLFCKILDINKCTVSGCDYRALVGNEISRIYVEWKIDEYRIYISKLRFINSSVNSLDFL